MSLLNARSVSKSYGAARVLRDVTISIEPGEIVSLAGENGSGKSTFAKILAGLTPQTEGTIEFDGIELSGGSPQQSLAAGIGIVPQEVAGFPDLTVTENVLMSANHSLLSLRHRRRDRARLQEVLAYLGVEVDPDALFGSLPSGTAALVELARALVSEPKLLIIDETTAYLEAQAAARLLNLLREIRERDVSIIFISHRLAEVEALVDRTIVLRDGSLVGELARSESTPERIAQLMVGREIEVHERSVVDEAGRPRLTVEPVALAAGATPIELQIRPGEVVGVTGLVNSGCSELLDHVAGARSLGPTVAVDGTPVAGRGLRAALRAGIVMLPGDRQRQGLLREASVRDNMMLGAWSLASVVSRSREQPVVSGFIDEFAIRPGDPDQTVRLLSGGNQQKVMLARAMRREPRVLVLNEPTRGVDIGARADVYRVISRSLKEGISVLFFSTDMHEVIELSDRVLVMYDNQLAAELAGDQITEDNIARYMGGSR